MYNSIQKLLLASAALSLIACSQAEFSSESMQKVSDSLQSSSQAGSNYNSGFSSSSATTPSSSYTAPSSSSAPASSTAASAVLPTTACKNVTQGGLDFRLEDNAQATFQKMRIISLPSSPRGTLEAYSIYELSDGKLHYELESSEFFINDKTDNETYACVVGYSEIQAVAQKNGYSSMAATIPHLAIEAWLNVPKSNFKRLVGMSLKNTRVNEFAVQCF